VLLLLQRSRPPDGGVTLLESATLTSTRLSFRYESQRQLDRVLLVRPTPFDVGRFRRRPSGFLLLPSPTGFTRRALLTAAYSSPRSFKTIRQPHPLAQSECTSLGVPSPTARDKTGCPYVPKVPPSGTVRPQGFSPSRRLASPNSLQALFHARCALGVPTDDLSSARPDLSVQAGRRHPRSLSKAFSPPVTSTCSRALLSRASPGRLNDAFTSGTGFPVTQPGGHHRVSITRGTVYPLGATLGHQPS